MTPTHQKFLTALIARECGQVLEADSGYESDARLAPVAQQFGHDDINHLIQHIMTTRAPEAVRAVVEAIVTNETCFFRNGAPFRHFSETALPALLAARAETRTLRIWSAAASTGQEAYSLAMLLTDRKAALSGWRVQLLATDISESALAHARAGEYSQFEVQRGLPIRHLVAHFKQAGDRWRIKSDLRKTVRFEQFNLLDDPSHIGCFDVIFCRNVLSYFDQDRRKTVLDSVARQLNPDGYLYLGDKETVTGAAIDFVADPTTRGLFQPREAPPGQALAS